MSATPFVPSTPRRLAEALDKAGAPPEMVDAAEAGFYDDFRSPVAFPITQLIRDCHLAELPGIAERAMAGDFDATKEESAAWARSPEGRRAFRDRTARR